VLVVLALAVKVMRALVVWAATLRRAAAAVRAVPAVALLVAPEWWIF
jgi:hypothetical protein